MNIKTRNIKDRSSPPSTPDEGTDKKDDGITPEQAAVIAGADAYANGAEENKYQIHRKTISLPQFSLDLIKWINDNKAPADFSGMVRAALLGYSRLSVEDQITLISETRIPNNKGRKKNTADKS